MDPTDLGLPYAAWRPGQWELIATLASRPERYLILEAPTGVGKSAVALGLARLLGGPQDQALILVATKQLQSQYAALLHLPTATGRANWQCNLEPEYTAAEALCTLGGRCPWRNTDRCDYYAQKRQALRAPEAVLNYAYWLAQANHVGEFRNRALLVCDEAHGLDDELRKFASVALRRRSVEAQGLAWLGGDDVEAWQRWARQFTQRMASAYEQCCTIKELDLTPGERRDRARFLALYRACEMLGHADPRNWVTRPQPWGMEFIPVWVHTLGWPLLFQHARRVLCMSATVLDKDLFCEQLGLPPAETAFVRAPCPFPASARPLRYRPVGRVKATDERCLDRLAHALDAILDAHPQERGLVHTASHKLAQALVARSRHTARLITHDTASRARALEQFRAQPGAVLVSPSVTTGVDLPYDFCRFQVLAKLAFPDLGDKQIKQRMRIGADGRPAPKAQAWYNWHTLCQLIQAYGRGVRAADDYAVTYLLDGNWGWLSAAARGRGWLPDWVAEAIRHEPPPAPPNPLAALAAIQQPAPRTQ